MKSSSPLLVLLFLSFSLALTAQDQEKASSMTLVLNQDNAFGFYPAIFGNFGVSEQSSATFYSLFWTNASFGSAATVSDLWTEVGLGWSWNLLDGRWLINPTLGLTNGKLLSGGAQGVIGDGIVPGLTSFYLDDNFEVEVFAAYYKALRREGPVTSDYALYWIYPGVRFSKAFSAGFQAESFRLLRTDGGDPAVLYTWAGVYAKVTVKETWSLRFSGGLNFKEGSAYSREYYKLGLVAPFGL